MKYLIAIDGSNEANEAFNYLAQIVRDHDQVYLLTSVELNLSATSLPGTDLAYSSGAAPGNYVTLLEAAKRDGTDLVTEFVKRAKNEIKVLPANIFIFIFIFFIYLFVCLLLFGTEID